MSALADTGSCPLRDAHDRFRRAGFRRGGFNRASFGWVGPNLAILRGRLSAVWHRDLPTRGSRMRTIETGQGSPVLFVHDVPGDHASFLPVMKLMAGSYRAIAPDLPGYGASEKPSPSRYAYSFDAFAESLFDLAAVLDLGRLHVVGHGLGGGVAVALAAHHPALVHKLVLVDAIIYPLDAEPVLDRIACIPLAGAVAWRQMVGRSLFRAYVRGLNSESEIQTTQADRWYEAFNSPMGRRSMHATLVARADTRSLMAHLPRIATEALVVWGRNDRLASVEQGRSLARELRGHLNVLECGRFPHEEAPQEFASLVGKFLEGNFSSATSQRRSASRS